MIAREILFTLLHWWSPQLINIDCRGTFIRDNYDLTLLSQFSPNDVCIWPFIWICDYLQNSFGLFWFLSSPSDLESRPPMRDSSPGASWLRWWWQLRLNGAHENSIISGLWLSCSEHSWHTVATSHFTLGNAEPEMQSMMCGVCVGRGWRFKGLEENMMGFCFQIK